MLAELHKQRCARAYKDGIVEIEGVEIAYREKPGLALGSIVWHGTKSLCEVLRERCEELRGKKIVELGCGIGICSIFCKKIGLDITSTDKDDTLGLVRENARINCVDVTIVEHVWGSGRIEEFDVIVGSDIVYYDQNTESLLRSLLDNSKIGSRFFLCYIRRHKSEEVFFKRLLENWVLEESIPKNNYTVFKYARLNNSYQ